MKRGALLYVAGLLLGAVAVFCATYFFGRHTSLEVELERLTARRPAPPDPRSGGIPSPQQQEAPRAPEVPVKPENPGRLPDLTEAERNHIEAMTQALVKKLLHAPTNRQRAEASSARASEIAAFARTLFNLSDENPTTTAAD